MITAFLLTLASVPVAHAYDITGHWEGTYKCKGVDDGEKDSFEESVIADITQTGTATGGSFFFGGSGSSYKYNGLAVANAAKPDKGDLALVICGNDDNLAAGAFDEFGRFSVSTKPAKGTGTIKGISQYAAPDLDIFTCKWKLTRTATTNPGLTPTCP
jgi:hypothetical protein